MRWRLWWLGMSATKKTRLGIGYRPELAYFIERHRDIGLVEVLAQDFHTADCIPDFLIRMAHERDVEFVVHSTMLDCAGATPLNIDHLDHVAAVARRLNAVRVSDHLAFVRSGELESGHLIPPRRSGATLQVVLDNIASIQRKLPVPLVLENIATTFDWPDHEMSEAHFLSAILHKADCELLLDVSNLFANACNVGVDADAFIESLPLDRLFYVHVAGGIFKSGLYHDTHRHEVQSQSLDMLAALARRVTVERVMLERDGDFGDPAALDAELAAISDTLARVVCTGRNGGTDATAPEHIDVHLDPDSARQIVRAEQDVLLHGLLSGGASLRVLELQGFDLARLDGAYQSLRRKRARAIKRACPWLSDSFANENELDRALAGYFDSAVSAAASPLADGHAFMHFSRVSLQKSHAKPQRTLAP